MILTLGVVPAVYVILNRTAERLMHSITGATPELEAPGRLQESAGH